MKYQAHGSLGRFGGSYNEEPWPSANALWQLRSCTATGIVTPYTQWVDAPASTVAGRTRQWGLRATDGPRQHQPQARRSASRACGRRLPNRPVQRERSRTTERISSATTDDEK